MMKVLLLCSLLTLAFCNPTCNRCNVNQCSVCCSYGCSNKCQQSCCNCEQTSTTSTTTIPSTTFPTTTSSTTSTSTSHTTTSRSEKIEETTFKNVITVKVLNNITNVNLASVNISVNNRVSNNISNSCGGGRNGCAVTTVTVPTTRNTEITSTVTPVTSTVTTTKKIRCCIIIIPCLRLGCNPYHRRCGMSCRGSYGYQPINPCQFGCYKKATWNKPICHSEGCHTNQIDCSSCDEDFYQTYDGYSSCHGCFSEY